MKKVSLITFLLFLITLISISCIPSQPTTQIPPAKTNDDAPTITNAQEKIFSPSPENKLNTTNPTQQPTSQPVQEKKAQTTMRFGVPGAGFPFSIQQSPLVGQECFSIKGSFGLSGTITRPDKNKNLWIFAGQLEVPSEEYQIGEISYDILNAPIEYYTKKEPLPPTLVPQVMITIPIKLPPNAKDEKGNVKIPFRLEIPVPANAQFLFTMIDKTQ